MNIAPTALTVRTACSSIFSTRVQLIDRKPYATRVVNDGLVKRVRIAETLPGRTRVVFDLAGPAEYTVRRLAGPDRMEIEVRPVQARHSTASLKTAVSDYVTPAAPYVAPRPHYETAVSSMAPSFVKHFVYPVAPVPKALVLLPAPPLGQIASIYGPAINTTALPGPVTAQKYIRGMSTKVMPASASATTRDFAARPPANATRSLTRALRIEDQSCCD